MLQQEAIPFPQDTVYNDWLTVLPWFEAELTPHLRFEIALYFVKLI
jgi:hypothetical protein